MGHVIVLRDVVSTAAIDEIVASEAHELLVVGASQQAVAEHRTHHGVDAAIDDVDPDRREIEAGVLVPVLPAYFQQADVWAVYPSRLSVSAKVKVCVEFLEQWFEQTGMNER